MKKNLPVLMAATCIIVLMLTVSCAKKQVKKDEPISATTTTITDGGAKDKPKLDESNLHAGEFKEVSDDEKSVFADIHFDYDDFSLRPDAKEILDGIAEWLLQNPQPLVLVEGHCDDRGTNEYNLALGERRANSAKKYLVQLGVASKRVSTISYGEEKPFDSGQNEEAWTKNRRGHFLIR